MKFRRSFLPIAISFLVLFGFAGCEKEETARPGSEPGKMGKAESHR
jgi:hypothetical protein